ncbi:uncharacterized protein EV420DRAFT_1623041 [Desarmillaria tabescens]|uniref:Peptidase M20 domain-containing protein 2 n=1 Tax=Armillaria tabescens TaxID=1929756 RepID=A0AA39MNT9_ARMTA|nr:uncharacterized protein EV420DRAFT_1623041 [Desarmillaria tabescens]KAK0441152.1 hypothetical protein EV420DRAFT_1623041 [Desarmillaria tabescens]
MVAQWTQSFVVWASIFLKVHATAQANLSTLPETLQMISANIWPDIQDIGHAIYANPETALEEYFAATYGFETSLKLTFENIPAGYGADVPTLAFLLEYDALPGIKHACGHNLIATVGLAAATMTREALLYYGIPARIVVYGCFDEEDTAGKRLLLNAGAFDDENAVFMMAHPASTISAVQPMQARIDAKVELSGSTHFEVVGKTYQELVIIRDLTSSLPGHSTTASSIEEIGMYAINVIQTEIELGVTNATLEEIDNVVAAVRDGDDAFVNQTYTLAEDENGVAITFTGPGGHASEATEGPLTLSVETYRALEASNSTHSYYLPSNTSHTQLGITVSIRTRYTIELEEGLPDSVTYDIPYPALEVHEELGQYFIDLMATPEFDDNSWAFSSVAPAATDASFVQDPTINETSYELLSTSRVVFHPNYAICDTSTVANCPYNHEPEYNDIADSDYAYVQTEKVARALAHTAVQLANDKDFFDSVRSIIE